MLNEPHKIIRRRNKNSMRRSDAIVIGGVIDESDVSDAID